MSDQNSAFDPLNLGTTVDLSEFYRADDNWRREMSVFFSRPLSRGGHQTIPSITRIKFPKDQFNNPLQCPDGLYLTYGAVSFPELYLDEGLLGFAALFGFHFATRKLYLLSERLFMTIDPGLDKIDSPGSGGYRPLDSWLRVAIRYYRAAFFVYQETNQAISRYLPGVRRTFEKDKLKPHLLAYPWGDFATAMTTVIEWQHMDRLRGPTRRVYRELQQYDADPAYEGPGLHALCYGIGQIDRMLQTDVGIKRILEETPRPEQQERLDPLQEYFQSSKT